jgi:UDP-N-acetylmuramoylalanine--D-glutamate ligase
MPSPTSWSDLAGRRVGVWGLGVEGRASVRKLQDLGVTPVQVELFDRDLLQSCDVVVKSPGISRYGEQFLSLDVPVVGGLGLWLAEADSSRVLCITGTKGKSTTTSIAGGLLKGLGEKYLLGGNIGVAPWDPDVDQDVDWWVIETSSYQATDLEVGPAVVAVTSLSEDHLPWHNGSVETYYADKLSLCTKPGVRTVVADAGDPLLRSHSAQLGAHVDWVEREASDWVAAGNLLGAHNRRNAEIARRSLIELGVEGLTDDAVLAQAFRAFEPLPSRLTLVATRDGVDFVDDSISTNVLSTTAAVESFPGRRVALLVGGLERDIDYRPLAKAITTATRVFTMPTNGPAIGAALRAAGITQVEDCSSLEDAVSRAAQWAMPAGVVLLSPAAASFDHFADYRARGEAFTAATAAHPRE